MQDNGQPRAIDPAEAFRLIADFTYDWELWLGPGRGLLYVSPSCARISGYQPKSFLADPGLLTAIVHPDDRDAFARHLEHEFHYTEPLSLEFRIVTRTGEERWLHHVCQPVHGADGRWYLVISDLRLPGMGGQRLLRAVAELRRAARRILITGFGTQETELWARQEIDDCLIKPFTAQRLLQAVQRLLPATAGEEFQG